MAAVTLYCPIKVKSNKLYPVHVKVNTHTGNAQYYAQRIMGVIGSQYDMKKRKIYIVLIMVLIIIFHYCQKEITDKKALSIKEYQFQSAIGYAADDLSYYYETKDQHYYLYGISSLKAASWVVNWFPKDTEAYRAKGYLLSLYAHMVVSPDVVEKYLPEIIDYFHILQEDINDIAAYEQIFMLNNKITVEISNLE